jgi:HSP20 family protein
MPFGRRNPIDEIEQLLSRMGRELDTEEWPVGTGPSVDVADHGDRYVVTADLPGYEKEDIDVRLAAGALRIDADRELETAEADVDWLRRERRRESVSRRVSIPDPVDEDGITAAYNNGVLTVELPKQDADGGTTIDID